jgi:hypothetical protein
MKRLCSLTSLSLSPTQPSRVYLDLTHSPTRGKPGAEAYLLGVALKHKAGIQWNPQQHVVFLHCVCGEQPVATQRTTAQLHRRVLKKKKNKKKNGTVS